MITMTMKRFLFTLVIACSATVGRAAEVSAELTIPYTSAYTFRGAKIADASIQPGLTLGYGGATVSAWSSQPTDRTQDPEFDFGAGYAVEWSAFTLDAGLTAYYYPGLGSSATTWEPYLGVSRSFGSLDIGMRVYYDWTLDVATYEATLSRSIDLAENLSVSFGVAAGTVRPRDRTIDGYTYWSGTVELAYALGGPSTVFAGFGYTSSDERAIERGITSFTGGLRFAF